MLPFAIFARLNRQRRPSKSLFRPVVLSLIEKADSAATALSAYVVIPYIIYTTPPMRLAIQSIIRSGG